MGILSFIGNLFGGDDAKALPSEPAFSRGDAFSLMLANVLFRIDGAVSPDELEYFEKATKRAPEPVTKRISGILEDPDLFLQVRNWYDALSDSEKERAARDVRSLVEVDDARTQEEEAFLIQFAQIREGQERLDLYVSTKQARADSLKLLNQNLFRYLTIEQLKEQFPNSDMAFQTGTVYIDHPFKDDALIPFSVQAFDEAQQQLFGGIIELLKELGARRVVIAESLEEIGRSQSDHRASIDGGNAMAQVKVAGGADQSIERIFKTKETAEVKFDGSKPPLMTRLFAGRWHRRLLRKYSSNPQCTTIIRNRMGHNKASYFQHQVQSVEARNLANGINAAANLDYKLVKLNAEGSSKRAESVTRTIEKTLTVHFH